MMISNSTSIFSSMYGNKPYASVSINTSNDTQTEAKGGSKGPGGPGGPGGPKRPKGPEGQSGPNLDADSDGYWSEDEIDDFSSIAEEYGVSLDVSDIMSTYDTDGDSKISESERIALAKDNALQMPSPQQLMESMPSRPPMKQLNSDAIESTDPSNIFSQYIAEYTQLNNYEMGITSLFEASI